MPYLVLVLISLRSPNRQLVILAGVGGTILTLLGYYLSPSDGDPWVGIANRALALFVIWVAVILGLRMKRAQEAEIGNLEKPVKGTVSKYKRLLETAPARILVVNPDGRIHVVRDGEEALDFLFCRGPHSNRNFSDLPRLVLLDLKLPKVDGLEVLQLVKEDARTKMVLVVILTSSKKEKVHINGYQLGVNSYIQKPVDFDQFQKVIKQLELYWMVVNQPPPNPAFSTE